MLNQVLSKIQSSNLLTTALNGFILKIGAAILGFLNGVFLARLLGTREFGIYSVMMSTTILASTIAALGFPTLITRQSATYVVQQQWGMFKGLVIKSVQWVMLASLIVIAAVAIFTWGGGLTAEIHLVAVLMVLALIPIMALSQLRAAILRGLHFVILADVPELMLRPLVLLILLGASLLLMPQVDSTQAYLMNFGAMSVAFLVGVLFLHQHLPRDVITAQAEVQGSQWFVASLPLFGIVLAGTVESQIGIYILAYRASVEQVGLLQVANQMVAVVVMGLSAVNMFLLPRIAAAWAKEDRVAIQKLATDAVRLSTLIALISCVILFILAEPLLQLFGSSYQIAAPALRILVIGQLINATAGSCGLILTMTGQQNIVLRSLFIALITNGIAAWVLTPECGAAGAAVSSTLGMVIWNGLMIIATIHRLGVNTTIIPCKVKSISAGKT